MATQREINERWFFEGGYAEMNKLEQVDYLVCYCGWEEESAMEMVYGCCE